jgi:16S rRNA (cytosine967-C5)-methyltransferase
LVDLAAAPGGKSLSAIAHGRMRRAAAVDRSMPRLRRVVENTRRLGFPEIRSVAGEFAALPLAEGRHERVLLDAPCSGTGTLRKNPEIRYRVTPDAIERLALAQEAALSDAVRLLTPGGFLLYSTCSLEEEENERVVDRVLERARGLERAPIPAQSGRPGAPGGCLRLFPDDRTDGFTAQLLRRLPEATRRAAVP